MPGVYQNSPWNKTLFQGVKATPEQMQDPQNRRKNEISRRISIEQEQIHNYIMEHGEDAFNRNYPFVFTPVGNRFFLINKPHSDDTKHNIEVRTKGSHRILYSEQVQRSSTNPPSTRRLQQSTTPHTPWPSLRPHPPLTPQEHTRHTRHRRSSAAQLPSTPQEHTRHTRHRRPPLTPHPPSTPYEPTRPRRPPSAHPPSTAQEHTRPRRPPSAYPPSTAQEHTRPRRPSSTLYEPPPLTAHEFSEAFQRINEALHRIDFGLNYREKCLYNDNDELIIKYNLKTQTNLPEDNCYICFSMHKIIEHTSPQVADVIMVRCNKLEMWTHLSCFMNSIQHKCEDGSRLPIKSVNFTYCPELASDSALDFDNQQGGKTRKKNKRKQSKT